MAIRTVVFDVDGVLVRAGVFAEILERDHGLDRVATAGFFHGPFKDCVLGRADLKEAIAPFLRQWRWSGSVEDCMRVWFEADSALNRELLELVAELRAGGMGCYVASTQEAYRAAYLEDVLGLGTQFDGLFFSCRVGASKPDEAFFGHVASSLALPASELLLVDDHEPNVAGARGCGWSAELYGWGDDLPTTLRQYGVVASDA